MRIYHIYKQRAKAVEIHSQWMNYRWLPYEYIGYVVGTKELYRVMQSRKFRGLRSEPPMHNSLYYSTELFRREFKWSFYSGELPVIKRFLILDDKGRVRDYHELTHKYKKKHRGYPHHSWQDNNCRYVGDRRKSITPEEINEIKNEYGISMRPIKPKRNLDRWNMSECHKVSCGWKKQSKRRKQWKVKMVSNDGCCN